MHSFLLVPQLLHLFENEPQFSQRNAEEFYREDRGCEDHRGTHINSRWLEDGGKTMIQLIELALKDGRNPKSRRVFRRAPAAK